MKESKCPVTGAQHRHHTKGRQNNDWWPNNIPLNILNQQSQKSNPLDSEFVYSEAFKTLDYNNLKKDLYALMTDSQDWWPADYGHYGGLFIRMAWHSAGTYRVEDGRGGAVSGSQRFAPLNSWPDNVNLDKARRLLWPIKKKYGASISWADLMILAGNCALESMGFKTLGFAGGREDIWETEQDIYWGNENQWLDDKRYSENHQLENPLAAVQMGLIYVNPEGPNGIPDAVASGLDIKETFKRMAMNDEETVALIAGGHTFGKCHGAASPDHVGKEPEGSPLEQMGLGWHNTYQSGLGNDTISSGIEGPWNSTPTKWDMGYFDTLFGHDWNLVKSPAGAWQWVPADPNAHNVISAHDKNKTQPPIMTTADLALRMHPVYKPIAKHFHENPKAFEDAFAKAWFKLTHRDLGPRSKYLGPEIPSEVFIWQDPVPKAAAIGLDANDIQTLKEKLMQSSLSISDMVTTAWASASTYRHSDFRGGANGGRIQLSPQKDWPINQPENLNRILDTYRHIKDNFNNTHLNKKLSLADIVILAGNAAIEKAIASSGYNRLIPFSQGRTDASQDQTDQLSFAYLEPKADGFRNYFQSGLTERSENLLIDQAQLLNLTAPEMTVLLGGMRVLNANYMKSDLGKFTLKKETLSNDFFINILDMNIKWVATKDPNLFEGYHRVTKERLWTASRVDLIFGSHSVLRALSEVYASDDAMPKFIDDFISAWNKVMNADRFDVK